MATVAKLPEIDIAVLLADPTSAASRTVADELTEACHDPGFCYLSGHGVSPELERRVMANSRGFFDLDDSAKRDLAITNSPHFRGYTRLGGELTRGMRDWREQLDVGLEEPRLPPGVDDPLWSRLRGPNQWPPELPALGVAVLEWMDKMQHIALAVLRALSLGLGQGLNGFDKFLLPRGDPHLKIIRYPAQVPGDDTGQGVGLHHDSGLLSFVMQAATGGLQVAVGDELVEAIPLPNTYVMNLGEMMQAATDGYLRATKHRVESTLR